MAYLVLLVTVELRCGFLPRVIVKDGVVAESASTPSLGEDTTLPFPFADEFIAGNGIDKTRHAMKGSCTLSIRSAIELCDQLVDVGIPQ